MASPRGEPDSTPICRCRVLYLGSAVPHVTKDGLQGIQEPLRELYPEQGALGARGIDSWLSVWSNGLLLENVDENHKKVTRFFPIDSLHYCAAVRYVLVPEKLSSGPSQPATPRFLPLDSPFARTPNPSHPPLFAAILRRTTGIKVLECHAFICKREMAANALVRCCFHAYADSSYARNIDGGSSIYGTLRSQSQNTNNNSHNNSSPLNNSNNSFDKVEGWRRMSPGPGQETRGSTMTLNSQHNGTLKSNGTLDNISIYNGDENHKVWAGPGGPLDREELYAGNYNGSTMRSTKSVRPRQMIAPVAVPPPPPPPPLKEDKKTAKKTQKERARRKKMVGGNREELYPLMNGSLMRPGTQNMRAASSMSAPHIYSNGGGTLMRPTNGGGTLMRPTNGYHHPHHPHPHHHQQQLQLQQQQQQPVILMHPNATLPHPRQMQGGKRAGTFSHRPKGMMMRPVPPPFIPVPLPPQMVPIHTNKRGGQPKMMMEEPVYMPSARPMSPVASFQPAHFPHEAYLMQQYASQTLDKPGKKKRADKAAIKKVMNGENGGEEGLDVEESPYNTGIYRKKGHMNERAFSYSIRQEHRSRSYGSLANLKFATPIPNGGGPTGSKEEFKKEREIMQMMTDLELSGDELERREVPAGVYQHGNQAVYHSRQSLTVAPQNGRR